MNNPRPVMSIRKTVQLMVILTILAWATQTLFAQWGYGGLILPERVAPAAKPQFGSAPPPAPQLTAPPPAPAKLDRFNGGALIEVRSSARFATAGNGEGKITLRDICKWSDVDAAVMEPLADTLIAKIGAAPRVRQVTVDNIKSRLHDAGANLSLLQFTGSAECAILVGDGTEAEPEAPIAVEPQQPAAAAPADEPATAPAHVEEQFVLTRPLSRNQRIIASDIDVKRVQLDEPATRPSITKDQIIGNLAARDLKPGEVLGAADIKRPAMVTRGQFMTVAMRVGKFEIETVARAMGDAGKGEIVRAKNEANGDVYRVVITAPNEGRVQGESENQHGKRNDIAALSQN